MTVSHQRSRIIGFSLALSIIVIFGLIIPLLTGEWDPTPWAISGGLAFCSGLAPRLLTPITMTLGVLRLPAVFLYKNIVLSIIFFTLVCPGRLLLKMIGRDPLRRHWTKRNSYRETIADQQL